MTPVRAGVVGSPIGHTLSPALHRAAYAALGVEAEFEAYEVRAGRLDEFCVRLGDGWLGLAVTMPLKAEALALARTASATAGAAGAANTLLPLAGGGWAADNTDVVGISDTLTEQGVATRVGSAAVLGGGATARSAVVALARRAERITAYVRTPERADGLLAAAGAGGASLKLRGWEQRGEAWQADVVVATTTAHALDADAPALGDHVGPDGPGALLDVVYAPWPTVLAAEWGRIGGTVAGGLDLLVHQARAQVALMTGLDVAVEILRAAGEAELALRAG